eukprot:XP_025007068.1 uncharacterized protein LOC112532556 [Gallus gallus]
MTIYISPLPATGYLARHRDIRTCVSVRLLHSLCFPVSLSFHILPRRYPVVPPGAFPFALLRDLLSPLWFSGRFPTSSTSGRSAVRRSCRQGAASSRRGRAGAASVRAAVPPARPTRAAPRRPPPLFSSGAASVSAPPRTDAPRPPPTGLCSAPGPATCAKCRRGVLRRGSGSVKGGDPVGWGGTRGETPRPSSGSSERSGNGALRCRRSAPFRQRPRAGSQSGRSAELPAGMGRRGAQLTSPRALPGRAAAVLLPGGSLLELLLTALSAAAPAGSGRVGTAASPPGALQRLPRRRFFPAGAEVRGFM